MYRISPCRGVVHVPHPVIQLSPTSLPVTNSVDLIKRSPLATRCSFGHQHVSPRGLLASYLRTLVCMEGIVTKCTSVRPKLVKSVHFNPVTQDFTSREYRDSTAMEIGLAAGGR